MSAPPRPLLPSGVMTTLRIEHAITDYATWRAAFDRFADARDRAGVRGHVVRRLGDDEQTLLLDLEFDDAAAAQAFARFLEERVWSWPASAPALVGVPRTRVLEVVDGAG